MKFFAVAFLNLVLFAPYIFGQTPAANNAGDGAIPGAGSVVAESEYEAIRLKKIAVAMRISDRITIDGKLEEPAWGAAIAATDFIQWEPRTGALSSERTEARFLYDNDNLYVGITCWDSDPSRMIVNELKEDFASNESDGVSLTLDTLHDRRSAFGFGTNPAGARRDYQIMNDGGQYNMDWDGVWDVKVTTNDKGWIAEFIIPFKTLRFSNNPTQEWGLQMLRRIRRTNEDAYWSPIPRRFRGLKVSLGGTLTGLEGISQGRNFKVKPYVTAGITQRRENENLVRVWERDGGLDAKYGLTPQLTLDMTYRTDFSQVEVDQQQVNLTRFNLFFPEKRDFFLENAGTFSFGAGLMGPGMGGAGGGAAGGGAAGGGGGGGFGGGANLIPFFSRRIGLDSATGTPIPILGGTRLTGKVGNYDLGLLAMKTDSVHADDGALVTPSNNYVVARVKQNLLKNSWLGMLTTHRDSTAPGDFNRVYGFDARFQFWDKWDLDGYVMKSKTPGKIGKDKAGQVATAWRENDYSMSFDYQTIQTNFNPEVGFVRRKDMSQYSSDLSWRPRPRGSKLVRNFNFSTNLDYIQNATGHVETRTQNFTTGVFFQNSASINFNALNTFDRLVKNYEIRTGNFIPAGDYTYRGYSLFFNTDRSRAVGGNGNINAGDFWNGRRKSFGGGLDLKPDYHLNIDLSFNRNRVDLPSGKFTATLFSTRVLYAFSSRSFLNAFVQYNAETHQITSNIRFNITHRPLSDLYLVYNDRRDTVTGQLLERAFIVKFTNLFNF